MTVGARGSRVRAVAIRSRFGSNTLEQRAPLALEIDLTAQIAARIPESAACEICLFNENSR